MSPTSMSSQLRLCLLVIGLAVPAVPASGLPVVDVAEIVDAVGSCNADVAAAPVWADSISIEQASGSAASFVEDGAAFVAPGEELEVEVTFVNRVPGGCDALSSLLGPDLGLVHVFRSYDGDGGDWDFVANCGNALQTGGSSCGLVDEVEIDGASGEQRLRYLAVAQGTADTRLAGVERVLVVSARPDLAAASLAWIDPADPADRHTIYGLEAVSHFALDVANVGSYPSWNPNGGADLWGRSSFDAAGDGDESPDEAVTQADPSFSEREHRYFGDESVLPHCVGAGWLDEAGGNPLCSYRRGARFDLPVHAEVSRNGELAEVRDIGPGGLHPLADDMLEDKDDSIPHAGNEGGGPNSQSFVIPLLDLRYKAGLHDLAVEIGAGGADASDANHLLFDAADVYGVDLRIASATVATPGGCGFLPSDPCVAGSPVHVSAAYENAGDAIVDGLASVLNRSWNAGIHVNGEPVAVSEQESILPTTAGPGSLWTGFAVPTSPAGGPQLVEVRLDVLENYLDDVIPPQSPLGRVAERTEDVSCVPGASGPDNTFCVLLFFEAGVAPPPAPLPDVRVLDLSALVRSISTPFAEPVENPAGGFDVEFEVSNVGDAGSESFAVDLVACATEPDEMGVVPACELVNSWTVEDLAAGSTVGLSTHWDTIARPEPVDLCAVALYEGDEGNKVNNVECLRIGPTRG